MQLDARSTNLLNSLVGNPRIRSKDLEKRYSLTRRQLSYSFGKMNEWLIYKNLPTIERTRQGLFIVDPVLSKMFLNKERNDLVESDILTENERVYLIILKLLSSKEELSLIHFTSELKVSKNTILSDMKVAQEYVEDYQLAIRYSRREGYLIEGNEFILRKLLINACNKVLDLNNGKKKICELTEITEEEISELKVRLENVECKLNLKFTDEKMETMPYIISLIFRRIKQGNKMNPFNIHYNELSNTKEYKATEELLYDFRNIPLEERLFITLHLLTTSVHWSEFLTEDSIPDLKDALDKMVSLFERTACVSLQDKEQLLNKLLLHVKPAYYRIKYKLTEFIDVQETVSKEFKELHHLVRKSTRPLAELIGEEIPESETTYLTMLIGGWMTMHGESIQQKIKAIVVCPKGVSVSRLMFSALKEIFPEFIFLDSLSIREFHEYSLDYDIVFSPILLETDKKVFVANPFLEKEEKSRLRRQVMLELHGFVSPDLNVEELINIIEKYATIDNKKSLTSEIHGYLGHDLELEEKEKLEIPNPSLFDLITEDHILLEHSVSSWEEAIRIGASPIVQTKSITPGYVDAMVKHCKEDPYIIIGQNLAIPHASPEDGVNKVSMSLLRLEQGVEFASDYSINIVIVISATDKHKHLRALMQLMKLASSKKDMKGITQSNSEKEIREIIRKYADE
ncbi:BglG family transcription antiterminator [Radiobacillus kanasensis]|uniref:BglG family transcription antiterminator n=1 Tax=Radiobacillus kanasensis TaxID=2844358 RepID=UPI001E2A87B5|nr:BglG family transcription antiterminator [Radiobacillus kanasensis]UFT99595.1 BglG family transcription antiterminator [Radiobacillus kanasensis]